jgi:hypothetical protein
LQGWRHFMIAGLKAFYYCRVEGTLWLEGWRHFMIAGLKALNDCRVEGTLWLQGWRHFMIGGLKALYQWFDIVLLIFIYNNLYYQTTSVIQTYYHCFVMWHCIDITVTLYWYHRDIVLISPWHCIDNTVTLYWYHWHCIDITVTLYWYHWHCIDIIVTLYWYHCDIVLISLWHIKFHDIWKYIVENWGKVCFEWHYSCLMSLSTIFQSLNMLILTHDDI